MLESMIALARGFGLKTVAEGIESYHESHKLQGLGVMVGQGFLFAKPMPKVEFLEKNRPSPASGGSSSRVPGGTSARPRRPARPGARPDPARPVRSRRVEASVTSL